MSAPQFSEVSRRALEVRALDVDYALEMGVRPVLSEADLPDELRGNRYAVTPGMLFPWVDPLSGERTWQFRPDSPVENDEGKPVKYVFPVEQHQNLSKVRGPRNGQTAVDSLIVEGTMQSLAAARYAADNVAVYAIPGCWGWSSSKAPTHLLTEMSGTRVVIVLDADAVTKPEVFEAGDRMKDAVQVMTGAEPVFSRLGSGGSTGLDDLLAGVPEGHRAQIVTNLIDGAKPKPADRKPPGKPRRHREDGLPAINDTALGTQWADDHRGEFRYRVTRKGGSWARYRDGRWGPVSASVPRSSVAEYLSDVARHFAEAKDEDTVDKLLADTKRKAVFSSASDYAPMQIDDEEFDDPAATGHLFVVRNGVINLDTGEFGPHNPDLLVSVGSDVDYDPSARCPRFLEFLEEVLPDKDVRHYLLRLFAVAMYGRVLEHVFPVLIGEGRNGKGALIRIMEKLFGGYAVKVSASTLLEKKFDAHTQEIAKLRSKRLASAEEANQGARWNVGKVKDLTGGDRLTGRFMHQDDIEFDASHVLFMATNHRPAVGDSEEAFWMRYREIPFTVSVEGREDPSMEPYIYANELPGILNVLRVMLRDYHANGLATPPQVMAAGLEARVETDREFGFASSGIYIPAPAGTVTEPVSNVVLNDAYTKYLLGQGVRHDQIPAVDRTRIAKLTRAFNRMGGGQVTCSGAKEEKTFKKPHKHRSRYWTGLVLAEGQEAAEVSRPAQNGTRPPLVALPGGAVTPPAAAAALATPAPETGTGSSAQADCEDCAELRSIGSDLVCDLHDPEVATR